MEFETADDLKNWFQLYHDDLVTQLTEHDNHYARNLMVFWSTIDLLAEVLVLFKLFSLFDKDVAEKADYAKTMIEGLLQAIPDEIKRYEDSVVEKTK